jgi:hypothetical protein
MESGPITLPEIAEEAEVPLSCLFSACSCKNQSCPLSVIVRVIRGHLYLNFGAQSPTPLSSSAKSGHVAQN